MSAPRDPYLDLPLHGIRLIEASAGTGKTYTLATLVTRLVVERGLRIGQILAVTFTEAATQELRKRIRERLQLTLDLLDAPVIENESAEAVLTRQLLQTHRQRSDESDDALRRRLRQATLEIDLAAIFTIHGFCARVLREHALESGHGFDAPELLANDDDLRAELAADLWRSHAQDATAAEDLGALWPNHEALADDLRVLLREPLLLPADAPLPPDPKPALLAAGAALADVYQEHGDVFFGDLLAAVQGKVLNGNSYRPAWINALWQQLSTWSEAGDFATPLDERIARLTATAMQAKANKGKDAQLPNSPMSAQIDAYIEAVHAQDEYARLRRAALLHRIRDDARHRLAVLKQQRRLQTYDDLIDGVADALEGAEGDVLAQRLREQYRVALVDEFQDTDARQWAIFDRVFGSGSDDPALFLIGDPKQAIYGFRGGDVHTYLHAAGIAERAPPLSHNFRSRPAVLTAIAALYKQAGDAAFIDQRIEFREVDAGGKCADADFQRNGVSAPAATVWQAPAPKADDKGKLKPWSAGRARELATQACVAAIHAVLSDARAGNAQIDGKPVQPGDIAVLVRSHREATMIQQALALVGIAAVAAGKQSLFATGEARDLHALLLALLHSGDDGRLRAALSTVLVGVDALGIDRLETDADAHRDWQQRAMAWRERLLRGGPLALVSDLAAVNAERLLGLLDGERRMSNYLQLAELLQEAQANALGLHGLVDWLGQHIASADSNDETQLLRLESDARRVQIVTLHKSKGLEYPLVFLPFVGIGRNEASPGRSCVVHDAEDGRRLQWKLGAADDWEVAKTAWQAEQRAEDARLLYVGLTRAEHALWLASGLFFAHDKTPLHAMLGDAEALAAAGIVFDDNTPPSLPRLPAESDAAIPPARNVNRRLTHDWWVYSFSQLAKADAGTETATETASAATLPASGGNDEPELGEDAPIDTEFDPRFAGNRYGVALHAALENADFAAWHEWKPGDAAPNEEATVIANALGKEGYGAELLDDGIALTTQLIGQTLTVELPEAVRLCDVPASERRAEIEFQFSLRPTQVDALLQLLHKHDVVRERHGFGLRQKLEGLMTGLIDLTYRHAGRWYVLDYKSNRLPAYDAASLQRAMAHSEYDLQALIYTLALHRWLRFRLGSAYDYARDFGGIRYLFCRGLDASRNDSPGIHAQRFTPELVGALDVLFGHGDAEGAAA
ncbi:exodeoxyribonuclease V subunit beta [Thermomonas sp. HDW16]|uniref:exodeoxyribonuclease V subunit beta n=1 Tax=Thermomonas sp. HDW16 TaxID=2714945 RepID=UPI00140D7F11|nr:exodeoxyribonuclease V subunit beta [Thermomonas sp. HDW16]QIL19428.1 exodeoxyribonuclease V subunit beta [Thermomonas sp. HDW16]